MKLILPMKALLFAIILVLGSNFAFAQNASEDVVYLKNGGIIRGQIIEQIPNQSLKIETVGRNVFVYKFEEIEKIVKEPIPGNVPGKSKSKSEIEEPEELKRGLLTFIVESNLGLNLVAGGQSAGLVNGSAASVGLSLALGINLHPKLSLGLGGGADLIGGSFFFPIFLDTRYFFTTKPVTPYISFGGGWSIGQDYTTKGSDSRYDVRVKSDGGIYLNPNIGIRINVAPKAALNFGLGARIQGSNGKISSYYNGSTRYSELLTLVNVKIGAIF